MKSILVLMMPLFAANAYAAGGAPSRIDCDRDTYRHFLEQGRYVLSIQDENDFNRHWEGFVNRANTEWKEALIGCGYNPQDLKDNLTTVRARMLMASLEECHTDAGEFRQRDYDRCYKHHKERDLQRECLDRADKNFKDHMSSCSFKEGTGTLGKFADRAAVNINIGGGGGSSKCDGPGGSCSK